MCCFVLEIQGRFVIFTFMAADYDDLEKVDREIRLNQLHNEAEDFVASGEDRQPTEQDTAKGLEYLSAWEKGGFDVKPADLLEKMGIHVIHPDELDAASLSARLGEFIKGLGRLGAHLEQTNHLSDDELYRVLWADMLFEETLLIPQNASYVYHWGPLGSWGEEEVLKDLSYYADDKRRAEWQAKNPGEPLPPKLPLKSDRDRTLP